MSYLTSLYMYVIGCLCTLCILKRNINISLQHNVTGPSAILKSPYVQGRPI